MAGPGSACAKRAVTVILYIFYFHVSVRSSWRTDSAKGVFRVQESISFHEIVGDEVQSSRISDNYDPSNKDYLSLVVSHGQ